MLKKMLSLIGVTLLFFSLITTASFAATSEFDNKSNLDATIQAAVSLTPTSQTIPQYGDAHITVSYPSLTKKPFYITVDFGSAGSYSTVTPVYETSYTFPGFEIDKKGTYTVRALVIDSDGTAYASNSGTVVVK